jgi:hypothetical protein
MVLLPERLISEGPRGASERETYGVFFAEAATYPKFVMRNV